MIVPKHEEMKVANREFIDRDSLKDEIRNLISIIEYKETKYFKVCNLCKQVPI